MCRCAGRCCCVVVVVVLGRTYVQVNEDYLKGLHTTGLQAQSGGGGEGPGEDLFGCGLFWAGLGRRGVGEGYIFYSHSIIFYTHNCNIN